MSKLKLFVENFLVYGIGGIISKIIPLVMVPIITKIMPSTFYYGLSDLSNTVVSFGSALAVMGMYDAIYRMFFDKEDEQYKKTVCSTGFIFTVFTSLIVFVLMLIFKNVIAKYFFESQEYSYLVYLSAIATLVGATNSIVSAPTRMQNKRKVFLITNAVSPILSYGISIPLLIKGYYVIALPLAAIVSGITMEISFAVLNHKWFSIKKFDYKLLKQLLIIAIPLLPNFLIYWIFNSSDKIMITNILGLSDAGVYAIGSKLGHCSQLIYTAFAGGWQYFAFSTMKEKDQVKSNSMVFEYLGIISFICTYFICALSGLIFKLLFDIEYYSGYIIAPYLFLAPLLQMLFQVEANQFIVIKKTWPNMFILAVGALSNVLINFLLIPIIGIEGASIATLSGYLISDIICTVALIKIKLMVISKRFLLSVLITVIYFCVWRFITLDNALTGLIAAVTSTVLIGLLYINDIKLLLKNKQTTGV